MLVDTSQKSLPIHKIIEKEKEISELHLKIEIQAKKILELQKILETCRPSENNFLVHSYN